ncbi:MAG: argininosuccinate synthase [Thermoleophilia bacterium]|nr:argininosuccinate synthase [Thermoleophilia bacterium]
MGKETCVLAYSGGLDTSALIPYLRENYGVEVVAALVDVGRAKDLEMLRQRALDAGAVDGVVIDAKEEFVRDFVFPALAANALYEEKYPLVSALSRPLISKKMVELAQERGAGLIAHGCTAKGNDQVRFDVSIRCLDPAIRVLGPAREWNMTRPEILDYVAARGIDIPLTKKNPFSIDENVWGRTIECGELEDPWEAPPEEAFTVTIEAAKAPDQGEEVTVGFEAGVPCTLNGERMAPVELIDTIDALGGRHGFGRIDMIENRLVGIKSREIYETPGALALVKAHKEIEDLVLTRDLLHFKRGVEQRLADMIYDGQWFSPLADALRAFVANTQTRVSGEARLLFYKGSCTVRGRRSPNSLYVEELATYGSGDRFSHESAKGFVELWGLPLEVWARRERKAR